MPPKSRSKAQAKGKQTAREESPASEDSQPPELDPYELLRVGSDATEGEIKTAYKKLALEYHPGMHLLFTQTIRAAVKSDNSNSLKTR